MGDIESQVRNLVQQLSALGIVGPQAEAVARSLLALRNATDAVTAASYAESEEKAKLKARHQELSNNMRTAVNHMYDFGKSVMSTADGMASSQSVFTQITPMITFLGEGFQKLGNFGGEIGETIGAAVGRLGGPVGMAAGSKLGEMLGKVIGGTLGELASLAAMIFNQYLQQGEKVIQSFNNLSTVGITFGGSLTNMSNIISKTQLPLEMLATIAKNNAENLALLGGGVGGALERVAKAARQDLGPQLVTLYGGFVNLSDELADYMAMQQRRGVSEDALSVDNIENTKAYLYQLKEISALTGKSSKQLKSEIEARSRNAATQAMMMKMSAQERANYDLLMARVPEGAREALNDIILAQSQGMQPVSREFLRLQGIAPGLTDALMIAAGDLKKSPQDFIATMGKTASELEKEGKKYTEEYGSILYLQQAGRLSSEVISTLDKVLTEINANRTSLAQTGKDIETFKKQTEELAATSTAFTTSVAQVYGAQANLAVTLNRTILGDGKNESKFTAFANTAIMATEIMETVISNLDGIVSRLAGFTNARAERTEQQQGQINQKMKEIAALRARRSEMIEPYLHYSQAVTSDMPIPDAIARPMSHIDQQIKLKLDQLKNLEDGLKSIQQQEDERDAKKKEEDAEKARDKSRKESLYGTGAPIPVVSPENAKLNVNFEPLTVALQPTLDKQAGAIEALATAMRDSGVQIKRAVDRSST